MTTAAPLAPMLLDCPPDAARDTMSDSVSAPTSRLSAYTVAPLSIVACVELDTSSTRIDAPTAPLPPLLLAVPSPGELNFGTHEPSASVRPGVLKFPLRLTASLTLFAVTATS